MRGNFNKSRAHWNKEIVRMRDKADMSFVEIGLFYDISAVAAFYRYNRAKGNYVYEKGLGYRRSR